MANRHLSYEEFKNIFGDLGITEWVKYNWLDNNFNLPSNLVRVQYVETDGTQYIDTGVILDYSKSFSLQMKFLAYSSDTRGCFFSNFRSNTDYAIWTELTTNGLLRFGGAGAGGFDIIGTQIPVQPNVIYDADFRHDVDGLTTILLNGVNDGTAIDSRTTTAEDSLYLLRDRRTEVFDRRMKCYSAKIFVDGELVRSFIPVFDTESGTYELYDLITQQVYQSNTELVGPKLFRFTEDNLSNITYYGLYSNLHTFYIDLGDAVYVNSFTAKSDNSKYVVGTTSQEVDFSFRPQNIGGGGSESWNISRCYVFLDANSEEEAWQILKDNPVDIVIEKVS